MKSSYSKITAAMEKLHYIFARESSFSLDFWVDISHKRATNSTGIRANWLNCLLNILTVLLHLHNFPLLNINCTEPYLGPLYISYIMVQILNCKIPERVLLNGAICKRFRKVSRRWRCAACHLLQFFTLKQSCIDFRATWVYSVSRNTRKHCKKPMITLLKSQKYSIHRILYSFFGKSITGASLPNLRWRQIRFVLKPHVMA